jgi:hypothetical protein
MAGQFNGGLSGYCFVVIPASAGQQEAPNRTRARAMLFSTRFT